MRLFIYDEEVVCEKCMVNEHDFNEGYGLTDVEVERALCELEPAIAGDVCSICGVGSA